MIMEVDQKSWLAAVFDRAAPTYDRVGMAYHEHFGRRLVELAELPADAALLDVGCGRGAILLAAVSKVASLVGVDASAGMLEQARNDLHAAGAKGVQLRVMDAEQLDFADGEFDALSAAFLLFFLPNPERAAAEFFRVLRPGGRIAVSTWGEEDPRWAFEKELMAGLSVNRRAVQRPFGQPEQVRELLVGAGCTDVVAHRETLEIRFADPQQWWDWHWSFSVRGVLEQLDEPTIDRLREKAMTRMGEMASVDGFPMLLTAWVVLGRR